MNKQERTAAVIEDFKGTPNEFDMLRGILCMSHYTNKIQKEPVTNDWAKYQAEYKEMKEEQEKIDIFDTMMIAERMDEINRAELKKYQTKKIATTTDVCLDCENELQGDEIGTEYCDKCALPDETPVEEKPEMVKTSHRGYYQTGHGRGFKKGPVIYKYKGCFFAKDKKNAELEYSPLTGELSGYVQLADYGTNGNHYFSQLGAGVKNIQGN
jgi:hypothetical protein